MKLILALLISVNLSAQIVPKENAKPLIVKSSLMFVSGFMDGTSEVLKIKYDSFDRVMNWDDQFWDYNISWHNKYRNGVPPTPKFPLSTTALVWTTDGYHLTRMIRNCTMVTAIVIPIGKKKGWKQYLAEGIIMYVAYTGGFNTAYDVVYK